MNVVIYKVVEGMAGDTLTRLLIKNNQQIIISIYRRILSLVDSNDGRPSDLHSASELRPGRVTGERLWQVNIYQKDLDDDFCPTRSLFEDFLNNGDAVMSGLPATLNELLKKGIDMVDVR